MGYIDKYVKLKHEDFQLSLWGGDVVLNKLDIRLDIIEQALKLPVTIKSGFVHELRIHVPWTRLYSEPVVITINTIECIINLNRNVAEVATEVICSSPDSRMSPNTGVPPPPTDGTDSEDLPLGYLQSIATKILHNISVVINNLVLKFVEEDIVLSVNIKSAECYSVDSDWNRSFIELTLPDLALRRVIDFHDLTLCLDKRNASGKIDSYQDPMLYRCSLTCRFLMQYKSLHAKLPNTTILNILNERLDVSITDVQLPMCRRLLELCIALYYGTIDPASGIRFAIREDSRAKPAATNENQSNTPTSERSEKEPEGWASWAWSYVPQLTAVDEAEQEGSSDNVKRKLESPVFKVGAYIRQMTILFKQSLVVEKRWYSATSSKSSASAFKSFLACTTMGIGLEVTIKDTNFFDVQLGINDLVISSVGTDGAKKNVFARSLTADLQKDINYMTGSLFDEVRDDSQEYIFEEIRHMEKYNESYAMKRYGCFWMNYFFIARPREPDESRMPESATPEEILERSRQRYILGPIQVCVSSTSVEHLRRIIDNVKDYDYEPYGYATTEPTDHRPSRSLPTQQEVQKLERDISIITYEVTVLRPCVCIEHSSGLFTDQTAKTGVPCSAVILEVEKLSFSSSRAMYDQDTSEIGSMLSSPSPQLLHNCHSHVTVELSRLEASLALVEDWPNNTYASSLYNVIQPFSIGLKVKHLLHPRYWKNMLQPQCEYVGEVESFSFNITMGQVLVLMDIAWSWIPADFDCGEVSDLSLLEDVFDRCDERPTKVKLPVMEFSMSGLHLQYIRTEAVRAAMASLASIRLFVLRWVSNFLFQSIMCQIV